jgi:mannan endo-1,4-beta-mannosidase
VDDHIRFQWGGGSPSDGISRDWFSVRWEGLIVPPASGEYLFAVQSDDGASLTIGTEKIIDGFGRGNANRKSTPIRLNGGRAYPIRLEFQEKGGVAHVHLLWRGPGIEEMQTVPDEVLRPPADYGKLPGPPFRD